MKLGQRSGLRTIASSAEFQILVAFFVIYAITSSGGLEVIDAEARYLTAKSWLLGNGGALPPGAEHFGNLGRNGGYYSFYGPLQSIIMTPLVLVISWLSRGDADQLFKLGFGVIVIPLISAISLALLFRALRSLRFGERDAFLAVIVIGLATPMWHYGRSGQEENLIGLAFVLYLWGMGQVLHAQYGGLKLIVAAAGIIFATRWSYVPSLIIILVPVALLLWQKRLDWRLWWPSLAVGSAFGLAVVALVLGYNAYRFGRPFENGYGIYFTVHPPFFTFGAAPEHLLALMFSPYRGLVWFCPALALLLGLNGVRKGALDGRLWKPILGAWIFTLLFVATFSIWNAGPAWAPRYLVALLVLLAPMFAAVFDSGRRWLAVIALSVLVQFCSTLLPSSSEDFVYDTRNAEHEGSCTPWVCSCSALCLRGPWAFRAMADTISSRALPVIDLAPSSKPPDGMSALRTSDFNSVYWWPVRAAYRAHKLSPALAFAICMLVLGAAFGALFMAYRRLPRSSSNA